MRGFQIISAEGGFFWCSQDWRGNLELSRLCFPEEEIASSILDAHRH